MVGQIVYLFLQKDTSTETGIANSLSILLKTPKAIYQNRFLYFLMNREFEKIISTKKEIVFSFEFILSSGLSPFLITIDFSKLIVSIVK